MAETNNDLGFSVGFTDVDAFVRDISRIEKATEGMAKEVVKDVEKIPTETRKSLRAQIREAQNLAATVAETYDEYSAEAIAAYKEVARLKDKQEDLNRFIEFMNPDKFTVMAKIAGGFASGLQTASGLMALLGDESEETQKVLVKLQAVANLAQGLQSIKDFSDSLKAVSQNVIPSLITSFKSLGTAGKAAIASTGIGLLAIAIGELIANWDSWFGAQQKVNKSLAEFAEIEKKAQQSTGERIGQLISERTELNSLVGVATNHNKSRAEQKAAIDNLKKSHPDFLKGLKDEEITTGELTKRINEYNSSFGQRIKLIVLEGAMQAIRDKITVSTKKYIDAEIALNDALSYQYSASYQSGLGLEAYNGALQGARNTSNEAKSEIFQFAKILDGLAKQLPVTENEIKDYGSATTGTTNATKELNKEVEKTVQLFKRMEKDALNMQQPLSDIEQFRQGMIELINEFGTTEPTITPRIETDSFDKFVESLATMNTGFEEGNLKAEEWKLGIMKVAESFKELKKQIKTQLIGTMGEFAESIGYAASGMGDFKTAFKDMLKGILPEVLKMAGLAMLNMAANPEVPFPLNLALLGGGLVLLGLSGLTRGLIEGGGKNKKNQSQNTRPGFQAPGTGTPAPGNGLGGFNTGDFAGLNVENLTLVVDGGGFKKTVLSVIQSDTELKGH